MSTTISPDRILKELAELWVTTSKEGAGDAAAGVLRACSMTLVVLAEESDDLQALGETVAALMPEHPARAIVVKLIGGQERALSERVYQQCWMPFGQRRQICCEQIELTASDASLEDLPSVVLPLTVPDLPVILWCRTSRILSMPGFYRIAAMARKVIVDSYGAADPEAATLRMSVVSRSGVLLGDLSWTRLTRWREMLSQVFENQEYLARLQNIRKVRVGAEEGLAVAARLMGVWIRNALSAAGIQTELEVTPAAPGGPSLRVELSGEGIGVELVREEDRLVITVNGLSNCTNLSRPTDYLLMREELAIVRHDPVFDRTLESAAALVYPSDK
ncbi:MAG TPA: glucose-6-phosphate dehydrogenase assembly protein OpcA [Bryobacteraceae bacterium]|nr:glucose-6-phosphate dehydrogenase assembly protein OpcA [Bryobacteraceae bacterium]